MRKLLFLVVASLLSILLLPAAPAESAGGRYIASSGAVALWCSADPHPLFPGDPDPADPVGWLLSADPYCAPADALNAASDATGGPRQEVGIGGFAFFLPAGTSQIMLAAAEDLGGSPPLSTPNGDYCSAAVLETFAPLSSPSLYWVLIGSVHVTDDLNVCTGTTGTISGSW